MGSRYTRDGGLTKDTYTGLLWNEDVIMQVNGDELLEEYFTSEWLVDGWRIPTAGELLTLWETMPRGKDSWDAMYTYWTSSNIGKRLVHTVDFSDGAIRHSSRLGSCAVILVKDSDRKVLND